MRQITRETLLYTEMIMDQALLNNLHRLEDFLGMYRGEECPLAVQLGGSTVQELAEAAWICEKHGSYSEINLNTGCPSNKARRGGFGAELMLNPELVRQLVDGMSRRVTHTPITVKCRLGVTGRETWEQLREFVEACRAGGVRRLIVHARCCVLRGLSPAQNRSVPPLRQEDVHRLVAEYPDMSIVLNGGVTSLGEAADHLGLEREREREREREII